VVAVNDPETPVEFILLKTKVDGCPLGAKQGGSVVDTEPIKGTCDL
jgi:hypothetical protein